MVSPPQQRILDALARLASVRVTEPSRTQVALFAGASPKSSAFGVNIAALSRLDLIDTPGAGLVALTHKGRAAAAAVEVPVSSAELQRAVAELVGRAKWKLLKVLLDWYPRSMSRLELADAAGVSSTSSAFGVNISALRSFGFVDVPEPGMVAAEAVLFVEEAMLASRAAPR